MSNAQDNLDNYKIIDNQTIALSTSFTSAIININERKLIGNVTLHIELTGTGTASFSWEQSNSYSEKNRSGSFIKPVSGSSIVTGFTITSGSNSDGKDLLNIPMFNSQFFRIVATETGGANAVIVNAWLSMQ